MNIVLIGAGNVSVHLGQMLGKKGHTIVQVYNRSASGKKLAKKLACPFTNSVKEIFTDADVYIIAIADESIVEFLKTISFNPSLIVHTSGSTGLNVFPERMKNTGVLYPLQTFSKENKKTPEIVPFCIEGNGKNALQSIKKLANSLSASVYHLNTEQRSIVHLSAVFVNNFPN